MMRDSCLFQFSPDGSRVASASADGRLTIWNSNSEVYQQYSPSAHLSAKITTLSWCPSPTGKTPKKKAKDAEGSDIIALGTSAGTVLLYSVRHGDAVTSLEAALSTITINAVVWSNKSIIAGAEDGMVSIFSVMTLQLVTRINTGKDSIYSLAITPDDKSIICGSRKIHVWNLTKQSLQQTFVGHANEVRCLRSFEKDGEFFALSAAEDDRNISVWKLEARTKPKKADSVHVTLSVNEPIIQLGTMNSTATEEIFTSVTTDTGSVAIFRFNVEKQKTSPYKSCNDIQILNEEGTQLQVVPVCANILKQTDTLSICVAYGSDGKLQLETIKVSELRKKHILSRKMPTIKLDVEEQKDFSKVVKPKVPDTVKYLSTGNPLPSPVSGKGVKRKQETDSNIQSLEERLALLNSKINSDEKVPKTDSLAQLLVQGLNSKDSSILMSVLDREEGTLIENTVRSLPVEYIVPLLTILQAFIQGKGSAGNINHVKWTQSVVINHAGYLISSPNIQKDILQPLSDMTSARTSSYLKVLKLRTKIEMIKGQMERNKDGIQANTDKPALLVFQDNSDNESEFGDRNAPLQGDYDSDYLDQYLSNGEEEGDNSDEENEDDDDDILAEENDAAMEDIQENGTVFLNGHTSDMEED